MMKALIIAAGRGNRLKPITDSDPKPLTPLLGLKLIERVILSSKGSGIKEFVVVTGYRGEKLREALGDGDRYGVKIEYVGNRDWEKGNGTSVFEARELLKERFILLMADHIFDPKILSALKKCKVGEKECFLCVDRNLEAVFDIDDATKVKVVEGRVEKIGKGLKEYNGVDMGVFLCSPYFFEVLKKNINGRHYSLTESVRDLAKQGGMRAYSIEDACWVDVDTVEDLKFAENMLLFEASKHALATRIVYRYLNTPLTRLLAKTPITPNQVTLLSLFAAIAAASLFIYRDPFWAGILALLSSVLDGVDGKLARIKHKKTAWGGIFDSFIDLYTDFIVFFGMAYYVYTVTLDATIWLVASLAFAGTIAVSVPAGISTPTKRYWVSLSKLYRCYPFRSRLGWIDRWIVELSPASKDMRYLWIGLGGLLGQVIGALWAVAIVTNVMAVYRLVRAKATTERLSLDEVESYLEKLYTP